MTAHAPLDRLAPADFYRQLDWLRDEWGRNDVPEMMRKIVRLRKTFAHLPDPYYSRSLDVLETIKRLDDDPTADYCPPIRELVEIVREWDSSRLPLLACPECGYGVRGHRALANHRYIVHGVECR